LARLAMNLSLAWNLAGLQGYSIWVGALPSRIGWKDSIVMENGVRSLLPDWTVLDVSGVLALVSMLKIRLAGKMSSFVGFAEHGGIGYSSGVHYCRVDRRLAE
jgi:hypothetical protein